MFFCPDTSTGECIGHRCVAYKTAKPSLVKCTTCSQTFNLGGTCTQEGHLRSVAVVESYHKCVKYNETFPAVIFGKDVTDDSQ